MASTFGVYKCNVCGNVVGIYYGGDGELMCCEQSMAYLKENTMEASQEKHIPVVTVENNRVSVKVGSTPHPMEQNHYIVWIELIIGKKQKVQRKYLQPGDAPEATFYIKGDKDVFILRKRGRRCPVGEDKIEITVRAYCNLHGLWQTEEL